MFPKIKNKYALNNSYFKNRRPDAPANPTEVMQYFKKRGELPFKYEGSNWLYDCYVEYQKRAGVQLSQFFTPDATAARIAELLDEGYIYTMTRLLYWTPVVVSGSLQSLCLNAGLS